MAKHRKARRGVRKQAQSIISDEIFIPNHSGEHTAGTTGTPIEDRNIANKKYVDDEIINNAWLKFVAQTGLTGDKTGSFDLTTTGTFDVNIITNLSSLNFNSASELTISNGAVTAPK